MFSPGGNFSARAEVTYEPDEQRGLLNERKLSTKELPSVEFLRKR
jgi:hypothetical protein